MEFFLRHVYPWLVEVSSASILLPFLVAIYLLRKNQDSCFKLLFAFVTLSVIQELLGQLTVLFRTENNLWINHLFTPIEFCLLAAIYYHAFTKATVKKLILLAVIIILFVSVLSIFMLEPITQVNSVPRVLMNTFSIAIAIGYFYKLTNDQTSIYLDKDPVFLLSCGVLIYYTGTSMAWAMFNDALDVSYDAARICLTITLMLNILLHCWWVFVLRRMAA